MAGSVSSQRLETTISVGYTSSSDDRTYCYAELAVSSVAANVRRECRTLTAAFGVSTKLLYVEVG